MFLAKKTTSASFITAARSGDQVTISRYYHQRCVPIIGRLNRRFSNAGLEVVKSAVNDAVMTIIEIHIKPGRIRVEGGKVIGLKQSDLSAFITFIARCTILRQLKWLQKYGTVDIENHLLHLEQGNGEQLDAEDKSKADRAVMRAFHDLRDHCQEVLACRLIHGMSYQELLSEDVGATVPALRVEAHRCVKQLRTRFLKFFFDAPVHKQL